MTASDALVARAELPRSDRLACAVATLRDTHRGSADHTRAWRAIAMHVQTTFPHPSNDDVRQDVLIAAVIHLDGPQAERIQHPAAWLRAVHRTRLIDDRRASARFAADSLDSRRSGEPCSATSLPAELAERVLAAFLERVDAFLASADLTPDARSRRRSQVIAALRRLGLGECLPEIADHLDADVNLALVAKWVERGRAVIIQVVEHERQTDPDLADFYAPLAELALERRADAGLPRPSRRKLRA